jgi:hypothetical protein
MVTAKDTKQKKNAFVPISQPRDSSEQKVRLLDSRHILQRNLGNGYLQAINQTRVLTMGSGGDKNEQSMGRVMQKSVTQDRSHLDAAKSGIIQQQENLEEENLAEEDLEESVQRLEEEEEEEEGAQMKRTVQAEPSQKSTKVAGQTTSNKPLLRLNGQPQEDGTQEPMEAPLEIEAAIENKRGSGQELDKGARLQMELAFGTSFKGVRVHTDQESDTLNRALGARAFTTGQDIFFRQGEYDPGSMKGRALLAHELTHVVQQRGHLQGKMAIGQPRDKYEQEADRVALEVMQLEQQAASAGLQRDLLQLRADETTNEGVLYRQAVETWVQQQVAPADRDKLAQAKSDGCCPECEANEEQQINKAASSTSILASIQAKSQVVRHLQALREGTDDNTPTYRQAISEFQHSNSIDRIATLQRQVLESTGSVDVRHTDNSKSIRRGICGGNNQPRPTQTQATTVDRIDVIDSSTGAIGGYPDIVGDADLNNPGPFNTPTEVNNVHQIHFHLDHGDSTNLTPTRIAVQARVTRAGTETLNVTSHNDGPPPHEIQRPSTDKIVIADAPGGLNITPAQHPYIMNASFNLTVAGSGHDIARIRYNVNINKQNPTEVPNTTNRIVATEKRDLVRNRDL